MMWNRLNAATSSHHLVCPCTAPLSYNDTHINMLQFHFPFGSFSLFGKNKNLSQKHICNFRELLAQHQSQIRSKDKNAGSGLQEVILVEA